MPTKFNNVAVALMLTITHIGLAHSAHYSFKQGGFTGYISINEQHQSDITKSGFISGSFDGADTLGKLDKNGKSIGDGIITEKEISNFSIHFGGNSEFAKFNGLQKFNRPNSLSYHLNNNFMHINVLTDDDLISPGSPFLNYWSDQSDNGINDTSYISFQRFIGGGKNPSLLFIGTGTREEISVFKGEYSSAPLPSAFGLFTAGIMGLLTIRHRKAAK